MDLGIFKGFKETKDGPMVTHLQFADDTLGKASREELMGFKAILRCFALVSGLRINMSKSMLIWIGLEESPLESLALEVGCGLGSYLLLTWASQ